MIIRVVIKAALLFGLCNLIYIATNPLARLDQVALYNHVLPGRPRFAYGQNPPEAYNLTLTRLEALFASHEISATPKAEDEYRVILLGDSSVWGWLLTVDQTLSACLNQAPWQTADGRQVVAYNLGYPILNVTKDLLILEAAMDYQPDMVVWLVTLVSLYPQDQLDHAIVTANPDRLKALDQQFNLRLPLAELPPDPGWQERTIYAQRRELADWWRYQVYGLAWWATGVDHRNPRFFTPVQEHLSGGTVLFDGKAATIYAEPTLLTEEDLAVQVIDAGITRAAEVGAETVIINEPIYRSSGIGSDVRYNFYYPRWAYDQYRELMAQQPWQYADLWDVALNDEFTDSSLHLTPAATCDLAGRIGEIIVQYAG